MCVFYRTASGREDKWITSICRAAEPSCVSLDEHLYEVNKVTTDKLKKKESIFTNMDSYQTDCRSPSYFKPFDDKTNAFSLDRLVKLQSFRTNKSSLTLDRDKREIFRPQQPLCIVFIVTDFSFK